MGKLPSLGDRAYWLRAIRKGEHEVLGLPAIVGLLAAAPDGVDQRVESAMVREFHNLVVPDLRLLIAPGDFGDRAAEIIAIAVNMIVTATRERSRLIGHIERAPGDALKNVARRAIETHSRKYGDAVKTRDHQAPVDGGPGKTARRKTINRSVLDNEAVSGRGDHGRSSAQSEYDLLVSELYREVPEKMRKAVRLRVEDGHTWTYAAKVGEAGVTPTALEDAVKRALDTMDVAWKTNLAHAKKRKVAAERARKAKRVEEQERRSRAGREGGQGDGDGGTSPGEGERDDD